jgi:hypothetical protein
MATEKEANILCVAEVGEDGTLSRRKLAEFKCGYEAIHVGKHDMILPEKGWIHDLVTTIATAKYPFSERVQSWLKLERINRADLHFPKGECQSCPIFAKRMYELCDGKQIMLLDVLSSDVLTGVAGEMEVEMLIHKYGSKSGSDQNN